MGDPAKALRSSLPPEAQRQKKTSLRQQQQKGPQQQQQKGPQQQQQKGPQQQQQLLLLGVMWHYVARGSNYQCECGKI